MTPDAFVSKWKGATLKERSAAQEHFIDLCRLLEQPTPGEADPTGAWYCFEKGAAKPGAGRAGPMSGAAAASAGSTKARARTSRPSLPPWRPPTAGRTTGRRCQTTRSCAACWR
jgi:hypothetical protein